MGESSAPDRMRAVINRLWDSGIDTALQAFWIAVWGLVVVTTLAFFAYARGISGPWLYGLIGAVCGVTAVLMATVVLVAIRERRRRALARLREAQFATADKGFLDFLVHRAEGERQVTAIMRAINKEVAATGKDLTLGSGRLDKIKRRGGTHQAVRALKEAQRMAKIVHRHSARMEELNALYNEATDLLVENHLGYLDCIASGRASAPSLSDLAQFRDVLTSLAAIMRDNCATGENTIRILNRLIGASRDVDTSVRRLTAATKEYLRIMGKTETFCGSMVKKIDEIITRSAVHTGEQAH